MSFSYTTAAQVQAELRATNEFSSTTYPSLDTVNTWIQQDSDEINVVSGRIWGTALYSETIDYSGEEIITLKHAPVNSVTSVLYSTTPLGTSGYSLSATKTDGTDYTAYLEEGEIAILPSWKPLEGRKRIQINYNAGYTSIPDRITKLATKKVTNRVMETLLAKDINEKQSGKSVSVGSISIVKPADFGVTQFKTLKTDISAMEQDLLRTTTAYRIGGHRY